MARRRHIGLWILILWDGIRTHDLRFILRNAFKTPLIPLSYPELKTVQTTRTVLSYWTNIFFGIAR